MSVASLEWILGLIVVASFFFLLRRTSHRQIYLALCSTVFLVFQGLNGYGWGILSVFLGVGYLVASALARRPSRWILTVYLLGLVGAFVIVKQYSFVTPLVPELLFRRKIVVVGLSYMLFRQIHLVVDAHQGQIERLSLWTYLNYQLNLFGLQAGPIQRYQDFSEYWSRLSPVLNDSYEFLHAYLRLFVGVIKVLGIAALAASAHAAALHAYLSSTYGWRTALYFLLVLYLFPAFLYFNFSGYCDIVIAGASLVGIRMPENFNYPFLSRNIGDLWTRWHRTLGVWIRDYLFTPLFKSSVERRPDLSTLMALIAYFVAFSLAGLWHGSTWNYLVFGLLNGLGVAGGKAWEAFLIKRRGRQGLRAYLQSPRVRAVAIFAAVNYFCFTLIFWEHDMRESLQIIKHLSKTFLY
jgi:D-alanyl-lipoteichoic acid acyltransferase DltB (MBOAT superfamily)